MNTFKKAALGAFISAAVFAAADASAGTTTYTGYTGELGTDNSITWNVNSTGGSANLSFELAGYSSLDGAYNGYTDIFSLTVNNTQIYQAAFELGGGGYNVIASNPNNLSTIINADNNPYDVTWAGGTVDIAGQIALNAGANSIVFSYVSPTDGTLGGTAGYQGTGDEGWGINSATVTSAVPEPTEGALLLSGLGLMGFIASRRKKSA